MPHSFSQTASLTCPQCGRAFSAEVWLIVDADERPDLAERIRAGTLHDVTCPHCGHQGQVDAPLLLLRPGATPPLLFSPAQGTTPEEDRQQAAGLVGLLQERMGPAWRDEWLAQGLPGVPRPLLPAALSDDPEAALRQVA
jgi:rRNA maturation protein Nop10